MHDDPLSTTFTIDNDDVAALPDLRPSPYPRGNGQPTTGRPTRWLTIRQMRAGDFFALPGRSEPLRAIEITYPSDLAHVRYGRVLIDGLPVPLTLDEDARLRVFQALRPVSVRCLICDQVLPQELYDIAAVGTVIAVCADCRHDTTGAVLPVATGNTHHSLFDDPATAPATDHGDDANGDDHA